MPQRQGRDTNSCAPGKLDYLIQLPIHAVPSSQFRLGYLKTYTQCFGPGLIIHKGICCTPWSGGKLTIERTQHTSLALAPPSRKKKSNQIKFMDVNRAEMIRTHNFPVNRIFIQVQ